MLKNAKMLVVISAMAITGIAQAQVLTTMTANTFSGTDAFGSVYISERWNTYAAPGPAWQVFLRDGAIPGNNFLNKQDGVAPDKTIAVDLTAGEHIFTFGVSHATGQDLSQDYYGLNLFFDQDPAPATWDDPLTTQAPDISVFGPKDTDAGDDVHPTVWANASDAVMGFPLFDMPGAGSWAYSAPGVFVTLTDYFVYPRSAGLGLDYESSGSFLGPFTPDGQDDIIGQYTLMVEVPEPMTMSLLSLGGLALIRRR